MQAIFLLNHFRLKFHSIFNSSIYWNITNNNNNCYNFKPDKFHFKSSRQLHFYVSYIVVVVVAADFWKKCCLSGHLKCRPKIFLICYLSLWAMSLLLPWCLFIVVSAEVSFFGSPQEKVSNHERRNKTRALTTHTHIDILVLAIFARCAKFYLQYRCLLITGRAACVWEQSD